MFPTTSMDTLKIVYFVLGLSIVCSAFASCTKTKPEQLPRLGPYERIDGEKKYHPVRHFELSNQNADTIRPENLAGKIRVADFFFISCPNICPQLQAEMLRIFEVFSEEQRVVLLSHTIDPKRDSVEALAKYAYNLGISDASRWHFLTGNRDSIYTLADDYFNIAVVDPSAEGGFDHSARITVVDTDGYIRATANGLVKAEVDDLIANIQLLLYEMDNNNTSPD